MEPELKSRIDRYANHELQPAAARALAQAALDDSELFEELTAVALAEAALESPATTDRALAQAALDNEDLFDALVASGAVEAGLPSQGREQYRPRRSRFVLAAGVATAAAAAVLAFFVLRPAAPAPAISNRTPASVARPGPPILLTADLQPASSPSAPIFRGGDETASRAPKSEGKVVAIEDGVATVNLGSVDGITKGQQVAGITITTVFRDRARGTLVPGSALQANDVVRVPTAVHLGALLEQINAQAASGNLTSAREMARTSIGAGSPGETRPLLERLAALDYQAGAADAARQHYEVAVDNFDQPPAASPAERAATLASYGTLSLMHGDQQLAGDLLRQALAQQPTPADRAVIEANLARLGTKHP
jgi:hypothetical protein